MILAAGRGERMRPLTDRTPKPLLELDGRPLIVHTLERLRAAGLRDLVINHAWLGRRLHQALGDGSSLGVRIRWSPEPDGALDTGGGIHQALPLLGPSPFLVCNGDVWSDFDFAALPGEPAALAHLVMVDNPDHHAGGDFVLDGERVHDGQGKKPWDGPGRRLTCAGIGVYRPALFQRRDPGRYPLAPLLREAMAEEQVTGQHHRGRWCDVGTPQRLADLEADLAADRGS